MKIFMCHSRHDKLWVSDLQQRIRSELLHDVWVDRQVTAANAWWETILDQIELSDCFIYIMSFMTAKSIYCLAQLRYALNLNKPSVCLVLEECELPDIKGLPDKFARYESIDDPTNMDQILLRLSVILSFIDKSNYRGEYPARYADRPPLPKLQQNTEQIRETFVLAEAAIREGNTSLGEYLFEQVMEVDSDVFARAAQERLEKVTKDHKRDVFYENIKRKLGALQASWDVFVDLYPDHDPDRIGELIQTRKKQISQTFIKIEDKSVDPQTLKINVDEITRKITQLIGEPFDIVTIPSGQVTLLPGGYVSTETIKYVPSFAISKYPITNQQFKCFIEEKAYENKDFWHFDGWKILQSEHWNSPRDWDNIIKADMDYPVVGISWFEAVAFCVWLSYEINDDVMLPSDTQWQRAAQGDKGYEYPWGNSWNADFCNNTVGQIHKFRRKATTVTQYENKNKSPCGVVDMVGNVEEWCLTNYESGVNDATLKPYRAVLRGGSWFSLNSRDLRVTMRSRSEPKNRCRFRGFRIALAL